MKKIVLLQHIELPFLLIDQLKDEFEIIDQREAPSSEIDERAAEVRILLSSGEDKVDAATIRRFPNLELIANFGVGYDGIDVAEATAQGVRVSNTPGVVTDEVADMALGFLIALSRQFRGAQRYLEDGKWAAGPYEWAHKVTGSSVGVVGMGRIGHAIAKRLESFGIDIHYTDRVEIPDVEATFHENAEDLARNVLTLIVCAPGGDGTRKLIDRAVLDAIGPEGNLINVARGSLVDQTELVSAVVDGRIGGVALDVFEDEPNVPQELCGRDNVILTPHTGTATWETRQAMSDLVVANIRAWLKDRSLVTPVN